MDVVAAMTEHDGFAQTQSPEIRAMSDPLYNDHVSSLREDEYPMLHGEWTL